MDAFWFIALVAVLAGAFAGIQGPINSLLSSRLGLLEGAFSVHLVGLILSAIPLMAIGGGRLGQWNTVPWYGWLGGAMGVGIVIGLSFATPRIGAAATIVLFLVAQLAGATIVGHFGWFETPAKPIDLGKVIGLLLLLAGAWLVVRPS